MKTIAQVCAGCDRPKSQWSEQGHIKEGQVFCCKGCADNVGCTCIVDHYEPMDISF